MPSGRGGEPAEVSRLTEDVAASRRCARSDFACAVVACARVASVQQGFGTTGVTRRSANRTTVDELGVAGGGVRSAPRRRYILHADTSSRTPTMAKAPYGRRHCVDRKSTRLNSSHLGTSYAVFCLKKKNTEK